MSVFGGPLAGASCWEGAWRTQPSATGEAATPEFQSWSHCSWLRGSQQVERGGDPCRIITASFQIRYLAAPLLLDMTVISRAVLL